MIAGLVDAPTCEWLRGLFDDDRLFSKTVLMDRPQFGNGAYRYFGAPIPKEDVEAIATYLSENYGKK